MGGMRVEVVGGWGGGWMNRGKIVFGLIVFLGGRGGEGCKMWGECFRDGFDVGEGGGGGIMIWVLEFKGGGE